MEKEVCFHILGIAETRDERAIKMAYMKRLKDTNPEDDQEGFKRLRTAYETAAAWARQKTEETVQEEEKGDQGEETGIGAWIAAVDACYSHVAARSDTEEWKRLLENPVCDSLDTSMEAREQLLVYLMNHIYLPQAVWRLLDDSFQIAEDRAVLEEKFPKNFLDYVIYNVENPGFIRYDFFRLKGGGNENADGYLEQYFAIKKKIDSDETEGCRRELDELAPFGVYHPYEDVERLRLLLLEGNPAGAAGLADKLEKEWGAFVGNDPYLWSYIGRARFQEGKKDEAYDIWTRVLEEYPEYYQAKTGVIDCLIEKKRYWRARELMMEILERNGRAEEVMSRLKEANEALIAILRENKEYREEGKTVSAEEGAVELAWCLFQNERLEETIEYLNSFTPGTGQEYSYTNLFGRVLYQAGRFGEARPYLERWLTMIQETEDDGTEEKRRRRSRLGRAFYILGGCCFELKDYDTAVSYLEQAAAAANGQFEKTGCLQYLAHVLCEMKQYEKSVDICDRIIEEDANYYPAYLTRQEACYELQKGQEVVDDYYRAIAIFAGYYKPYLLAAEVFFYNDQYEDARGVIEKAKENQVPFTCRMKLVEVKILRNLAQSKEERERPLELCRELAGEIFDETDLEDVSEVEFETALLHWDNEDYRDALVHMEEAIRKNSQRAQYRLVRGHIYLELKRYNEALREYDRVDSVYRDIPILYYNRGLCYEGLKLKAQAAENFERTAKLQEGYRDTCEKLADYYRERYEEQYRREDFDKAVSWASRQIAVTENCYYLVNRGLIYMNALELDAAIQDFLKALEYVPTDWAAYNNLGCCYKYLGRFEEAVGYFEKAAECMGDRKSLLPYSNMADCFEALGDYRRAIECYEKNLEFFPDCAPFWEEIGQLRVYLGEYQKAEEAYSRIAKQEEFYSRMGDMWLCRGSKRQAVKYYKDGIRNAAGDKKAKWMAKLGELYMDQMQHFWKAAVCFKRAIAAAKDHGELFDYERYLSRACYLMGRYRQAAEHAKKAFEHFKMSAQGTIEDYLAYRPYQPAREGLMGWLYLAAGDEEKALKLFDQMDRGYRCKGCRYPGCYEKYLYQGLCRETRGELELALEAYREAVRLNPHSMEAKCALENLQKRVD